MTRTVHLALPIFYAFSVFLLSKVSICVCFMTLNVLKLTCCDFFDHLSRCMTAVDNVSGPHGQILCGLSPEKVSFNAESCASPSDKKQLRARTWRPPVRTRVDQTTRMTLVKIRHIVCRFFLCAFFLASLKQRFYVTILVSASYLCI